MNEEELKLYNDLFNRISKVMNWDDKKTDSWFWTANPGLGNETPMSLMHNGRSWKLSKFVESHLEGAFE